ncbi:autotransporter outer membrane beta-barrel domain-containing protein [Pseudomonas fontis]|uniref:Autotransporter outer membrane beta-barrel domain-containing protein n=2 Tax=Pseudomonas fontis TaxID=2942633 RepID=A0ABT5NQT1_9PSED|nr:autotransporter outer membrane beta-barrel domain-containing protein [Pseudomonas fontis]MDD0972676.1 autotransporter outer membrane beta-barrel domain-containing protein [Pseudomonas fontis]MDD0990520.1 autotransporter outer membrane beta-barrel domain-containing protein [Pseudomonas fontis]
MFRKTLLALAVTATALPAFAETVQLTNAGYVSEHQTHTGNLEITGSYTGGTAEDAIELNGSSIEKDLILNATINSTGNFAGGVDMDVWEGGNPWTPNSVGGNVINKGNISAIGGGANALMIDPAKIGGSVINEGLLYAEGAPLIDDGGRDVARALDFSGSSVIGGDLVNASTGKIIAKGEDAKGINLEGGTIVGKVINRGLIEVTGSGATAIDATSSGSGRFTDMVDLAGIENHGTIIATGDDAEGIRIDGASFTGTSGALLNTGTIRATDAAIVIGGVDFDMPGTQPWFKEHGAFNIFNSGTIISADEAIDASESNRPVELILRKGSVIVGNLIDLRNIELEGDTSFTGTDSRADGYNIRMKDNGWVDVGSVTDDLKTTLTFEAPHTSIDGNMYVAGNSAVALNLSSATNANTPVLKITGTTQFGYGAQVQLAAKGADFTANGSTYNLIEAGEIEMLSAVGDTVDPSIKLNLVSSSALLKIDSYTVDGNKVVATVTGKGQDEIDQIIGQHGGSANSQKALGSLAGDYVLGKLADHDPLKQAFMNAGEADLAKLASELTPETNGGATQAATTSQTLVSNVTGSRTSSLRGASSGEGLAETGVWVQTLYSDASQDLRDGVAGYNAYSRGIAVGADGKLNDNLTLGLAYSFINTDVNGKSGNNTEVDSHAFTLYGGFEEGNYFVDASLTYGVNDNDSKRSIAGTQAKASYDSDLLGLNLIGGYTYQINPQVLVEPRVAARYSLVNIDGYREKGSSAALKVEDQRYEAIELGAGVRVAGSFPLGAGILEPQAKLMAFHDFAADEAKSTSTFLLGSTPFVTSGAKAARNSYEAGVGADYKLGAVTLGVNYDYIGKSGFDADVFSAKVRYDF